MDHLGVELETNLGCFRCVLFASTARIASISVKLVMTLSLIMYLSSAPLPFSAISTDFSFFCKSMQGCLREIDGSWVQSEKLKRSEDSIWTQGHVQYSSRFLHYSATSLREGLLAKLESPLEFAALKAPKTARSSG
jgi:hypothetical protein